MEPDSPPEVLEAGLAALRAGDWLLARDHLAAAGESAEALEGLGWALFWLGDVDDSIARRREAWRAFRARGDLRGAARVATWLAMDCADTHGEAVARGWIELARRALEGLAEGPEQGWLRLCEGHFERFFDGRTDVAREHALAAAEIARRLGMPDLEALADALQGLVLVHEGQVEDGMRRLDGATAAAMAGEVRNLDAVCATCCFLVHACQWVRDYARVAQWFHMLEAFSRAWNVRSVFQVCQTQYAAMLVGSGEWEAAEALLADLAEALRGTPGLPEALEQIGELRRRQGRAQEAEACFLEAGDRSLPLLGRAALALDAGAAPTALELLDRAERHASAARWSDHATALSLRVQAQVALGLDPAPTLEALEAVAETVGTLHARGLQHQARAAAAADPETRRDAWEAAALAFDQGQAPWEAAQARIALARALDELGCTDLARQEARLGEEALTRLGVPPPQPARSRLTRREVEVLRLVARGLGDKEVATKLYLSEHTVHRHVANILGKLGLPSRTAAVAHATRSGLI